MAAPIRPGTRTSRVEDASFSEPAPRCHGTMSFRTASRVTRRVQSPSCNHVPQASPTRPFFAPSLAAHTAPRLQNGNPLATQASTPMCHAAVQAIPLPAQESYSKWSTFTLQTMMSGGPYAHASWQPANESGSIVLLQPCATLLAEYTNALAKPKIGHSVRTLFNIQFKTGRSSPVATGSDHPPETVSISHLYPSHPSAAVPTTQPSTPTGHRGPLPTRRAAPFSDPDSYLQRLHLASARLHCWFLIRGTSTSYNHATLPQARPFSPQHSKKPEKPMQSQILSLPLHRPSNQNDKSS